jgi:DHA1 family bicyclomycin/chloramphenicol resistance-like MFS transporter
MTGIGPFTMQVLIPSMPALAGTLGAAPATVQLTLTLYLLGIAAGQLVYGPLSDRFGRRPMLLVGLAVYLAASLAAAAAPSIGWLLLARISQALGACTGVVLGRAIVRDAYPRDQAASVMGYVLMAMTIAPMLAPLLGSALDVLVGWRATMLACFVFGAALTLAVARRLPETLAVPQALPGLAGMLRAYASLVVIPAFRAYAAITACTTGVFFAFMAGAPFVVVQSMGYSPTSYALAFALVSVAYASGNFVAGRIATRIGVPRLLSIGTVIGVVGALASLAVLALLPPHILAFFLPMLLVAFGNGMTQPSAIAGAISANPRLAGTASGLVGALQMGFGALMTVVVGLTEHGAGIATAATMAASGVGAMLALRAARGAEA